MVLVELFPFTMKKIRSCNHKATAQIPGKRFIKPPTFFRPKSFILVHLIPRKYQSFNLLSALRWQVSGVWSQIILNGFVSKAGIYQWIDDTIKWC